MAERETEARGEATAGLEAETAAYEARMRAGRLRTAIVMGVVAVGILVALAFLKGWLYEGLGLH